MASFIGHSILGYGIGKLGSVNNSSKTILLCIVCVLIPDIDALGFFMHLRYSSVFGHRGLTHSILFAGLFPLAILFLFYRNNSLNKKQKFRLYLLFFIATVSHCAVDGLTSGGKGIAYFFPFYNKRIFLPYHPIGGENAGQVKSVSEWLWQIVRYEMLWLGMPSLLMVIARSMLNSIKPRAKGN